MNEESDPKSPEIAADAIRREFSLGENIARFVGGSVPVFAVGDHHVVKLFPADQRIFFDTEVTALAHVDRRLSIPTPNLVASGENGSWLYILMTRLSGTSLAEVWPSISAPDRRRLMGAIGVALAELHSLPTDSLPSLTVDWPRFVAAQRASSRERQVARGLGSPWLDLIDPYLAKHTPHDHGIRALLHTEIMREHVFVEQRTRGWSITGLVDFEPAMVGAPEYEFASVGLFLTCAEPGLLPAFLDSYGAKVDDDFAERIMAYALLHRYSNLRWYLERLPVPDDVLTLEGLAHRWFAI